MERQESGYCIPKAPDLGHPALAARHKVPTDRRFAVIAESMHVGVRAGRNR